MEWDKELFTTMESAKTAHKRIDSLEKKVEDLTGLHMAVCRIAEKVDGVALDISDVKAEIKEVREKPGKRWEKTVTQIISLITAALVGLILAKLGL